MILKVEDFTSNHHAKEKDWIVSEVLRSIPQEMVENIRVTGQVNVKLIIEGVEVEPELMSSVYMNIEKYIDEQAEYLMRKKMEELEERMYKLMEPLEQASKDAISKIKEEFNITEDEY